MPQWATHISKSPPSVLETRNSDCPLATKSSDDTSSLARHVSASRTRGQGYQPLGSSTSAGGGEDEDAHTGTESTVPDGDKDDIASFTSQETTVIGTPKPVIFAHAPPRGGAAIWLGQHALDLEELFESTAFVLTQLPARSISSTRDTCSTALTEHHLPPAQVANRLRGGQHLRALTNTFALPGGTREFSLQVIDLAQGCSVTERDPLAMVAGVHINVKLHVTPGQENLPHTT